MELITKIMNTKSSMDLESPCKVCETCKKPLETIVTWIDGSKKKVPIICECIEKDMKEQKEKDEKLNRELKLESLYKYSMMDKSKREIRFSNSKDTNKSMFDLAYKYCLEWKDMKKESIGFLFWGGTGVGKTHLTYCIANELLDKGVSVVIISTINLINSIYDSYNSYGKDGELEIIRNLNNAELLILDDLGAEHGTPKAKQIIYSILDSRSRSKLPTITTTNLNQAQLKEKIIQEDNVPRTYERLIEMCYPVEFKGQSLRAETVKRKEQIIKDKLLGGR